MYEDSVKVLLDDLPRLYMYTCKPALKEER